MEKKVFGCLSTIFLLINNSCRFAELCMYCQWNPHPWLPGEEQGIMHIMLSPREGGSGKEWGFDFWVKKHVKKRTPLGPQS